MFIDEEAYLEHYGVPGMRWGKRKAVSRAQNHKQGKAEKKVNSTIRSTKKRRAEKKAKKAAAAKALADADLKFQKDVVNMVTSAAKKGNFVAITQGRQTTIATGAEAASMIARTGGIPRNARFQELESRK